MDERFFSSTVEIKGGGSFFRELVGACARVCSCLESRDFTRSRPTLSPFNSNLIVAMGEGEEEEDRSGQKNVKIRMKEGVR